MSPHAKVHVGWLLFTTLFCASPAQSEPVLHIGVAANFNATLQQLSDAYQQTEPVDIRLSPAATGTLYAQIVNGAPYHLFFAADSDAPDRLLATGIASAAQPYAIGQLVLVYRVDAASKKSCQLIHHADQMAEILSGFHSIAIANPDTAPYGRAGQQLRDAIGNSSVTEKKIRQLRWLQGKSVLQAQQFLLTGHADAALLSRSLALRLSADNYHYCEIDARLYSPIVQSLAIIEQQGPDNNQIASDHFVAFLASNQAQDIIRRNGYLLPESPAERAGVLDGKQITHISGL